MLGDTGCGKSSLVLRFVTNNFRQFSESTIGASFMSKLLTVNGKSIKFQIWDTAGQVRAVFVSHQNEEISSLCVLIVRAGEISQLSAHVLPRRRSRHNRLRHQPRINIQNIEELG